MLEVIISSILGLGAGAACGIGLYRYSRYLTQKTAQAEAADIIDHAKEEAELRLLDEKERIQEIETELWTKVEADQLKSEERIENLQESNDEKKKKQDQLINERLMKFRAQEQEVLTHDKKVKEWEARVNEAKKEYENLRQSIVQKMSEKLSTSPTEIKSELIQEILKDTESRALKNAQNFEENIKEDLEDIAKKYIALAIDRFSRAYSSERGIALVSFNNEEERDLFSKNTENIKAVLEVCGCEILIYSDSLQIGVAGYDPVRRELTRRALEKIVRDKRNFNPDSIKRIAEASKKELVKNIKHDGDLIAKELGQQDLHPEIKQMMGSLRYRYSFTQNQYFHCGEVGWLAGLLAAEIRTDIKKSRRSGLLHDIGKSMDHAQDGGHAVIGADFIQARNEAADVVHAVRAHHYDEQPSTEMAFLVIAADAISGARPGARRSTLESYAQKVTELEDLARSFEGVQDCYILSGGREVRVITNGRNVDDVKALELSKQIAQKIEQEINYPGQIKVVVVRGMMVSETANQMNK